MPPVSVSISAQTNVSCFGGTNGTATAEGTGGMGAITYLWNNGQTAATAINLAAGTYNVTATDANGCTAVTSVVVTEPSQLTASITAQTNVLCNGAGTGSATVTATGGTTAYTYLWSDGQTTATATDLTAGTYTVTVTDANSCTVVTSATITEPTALLAEIIGQTNIGCNGATSGTATVNATGGTTAYSYLWSDGQTTATATGLAMGTYTVVVTDANDCTASATVTITEAPALTATAAQESPVSCFGGADGSASVTAAGGTPGYTYGWSNGAADQTATGLSAGTYTVTVTDANGCTTTANVTITQPAAAVTVSISAQTNVSCFGGTDGAATAEGTGGTGAITYLWNNGQTSATATNLAAGTYNVTATDANGCTAVTSVVVTEPSQLTASITAQTNVLCNGAGTGSATVTATGGTTAYTYLWSDGQTTATATDLTAGTYTVTVTDANSCTVVTSATITEPTALLVEIIDQTNIGCNGATSGTATVNATGGTTAYSYLWSDGQTTATATGLAMGTYTVVVTDANDCTASATVTITEAPALSATATEVSPVSCFGGADGSASVTAAGGTPGYTYEWSNGAADQTATGLSAGTYTVTVTDANGCTATATATITQPATAVSVTISAQTNVSCFGGTDGAATAEGTGGTGAITYLWNNGQTSATAINLAAGTYNVTATDANGCTASTSVVVTEPSQLTASITAQTNVLCNGAGTGSATVTAAGGTTAYTYLWSDGQTTATATDLTAGTYTVTVTDAYSCTVVTSATITEPTALLAEIIDQTNIGCNGATSGTATVNATGGTTAYSYLWSDGQTTATATTLAMGTYTVVVTDANDCTASATVTITEAPALSATASEVSPVSCFGGADGSASVTAAGGTPGYTYEWSNGATDQTATNLSAGTYTVTVTDANGCTTTANATITQPATAVAVSISAQTNVSCFGGTNGTATAEGTGGTGAITYLWNNGQTAATAINLAAGTYNVTATDANGCTASTSAVVTEPSQLTASITAQTNVLCNGASTGSATVTAAGGTTAYTYLWSDGQTSATATDLAAGTYTVIVTDANSCTVVVSATITEPTALLAEIIGQTNIGCNGATSGTATVNATGGTTAYSYLWSDGQTTATATGLAMGTYTVVVTDANDCTASATATITEAPALSATASEVSPVSCFGGADGSASVTAAGGTPGYTYEWSNGATDQTATNLLAGTYTVTVTDANGCTITANATITQPATAVSVTISAQTNVSCFGGTNGTATADGTGGTGAITYLWNNGQTAATAINLAAGTYNVTATDANGCTASTSVVVTEPSQLTASITAQTNVLCNGAGTGSATVTAAGGTTAYTYLWSDGQTTATATDLTAGTYTVTVTDANSCTVVASATITEPTALLAEIIGQTNIGCNGATSGTATVNATGGTTAYSYLWSDGQTTATATTLAMGTYTVVVTDANDCTASATVTITEAPALTATATEVSPVSCFGGADGSASVTAAGGTPGYTYEWSNGAADQTATNLLAGTYTVTVTDANGCTITANATITQPATAVSVTISAQTNVSCFGGTDGAATADGTGGTGAITYLWNNGQTSATAINLAAGTYNVTATDANGCTAVTSVVVTEPSQLTASITAQTNVLCNGAGTGSTTVTATGGTTAYTYLWSDGQTTATATDLTAGTYTVTVTDANSCTVVTSATITEPTALLAEIIGQTNIGCNGATSGTATVNATGGTTAYSYLWSDGQTTATATGLAMGTYTVVVTDANDCTASATVTITEAPALTATATEVSPVSCFGGADGSASVTAAGGTPGYTYEWSNGAADQTATGLSAGTYTVTVTDANGCTTTANATITQPATAVSVSISAQTNVSCFGGTDGTATAAGTGGTGAITYLWNNGQTSATAINLAAGTYNVTATDANGCTAVTSVVVTEPSQLTASITAQTNVECNGASTGSATVTAAGGTTAYTYLWSDGQTSATATDLTAGTYTVTVTDANSCTVVTSATITEPTALLAEIIGQTNIGCNGATSGTATVNATGGTTAYSYLWSDGQTSATATGLAMGTYTVVVTDANDCTASATVTITEAPALSATATEVSPVSCFGGADGSASVTAAGGTPGYTYGWSNGATDQTATNLSAGTYTVTVTDANGCTTTANATITQPATAVSVSISAQTNVSCFGGTNGTATAEGTGGTGAITYLWNNGQTSATAINLAAGTYNVTATDANGCTASTSVVVTEPSQLTASITAQTNVECNGASTGSATVTAAGGTTAYTYLWSDGQTSATATDLAAGTYTVTVTDANSCTVVTSATITQPTALVAEIISQTDVSCNGTNDGTATVNATGGTTGYTYLWSNGQTSFTATGLTTAIYTVTVTDANSCTQTATVTIGSNGALVFVDPTDVGPVCPGSLIDNILLTSMPNNPAIVYTWTGGAAAGLADGSSMGLTPHIPAFTAANTLGVTTVTVVATLGNCSSTQTFTISLLNNGVPSFISCPTSIIMIGNDPDQCSGKVNWITPILADDCTSAITLVQTGGPVSGSTVAITCPPTPITITYTATDASGNMATCSFQVMVVDTQKPFFNADITMPTNITVECDQVPTNCVFHGNGICSPLTSSDINDNCAGPLTVSFNELSTKGLDPNACSFYDYSLTRTWTASDCAGNSRQHTQVITVKDTSKPTAVCKNITITLNNSGTFTILPQDLDGGSTDNCAANANLTFAASQTVFTCADLGSSPVTVTLTVTDPCGNTATCTALVTILEGNGACNPFYDVSGSDPCVCLDNATTLQNGQFSELIQIHALAGQTWTVASSTGLYLSTSPAPPAAPNLVPAGTPLLGGLVDGIDNDGDGLTDEADESVYYTFSGRHVDGQGYTALIRNDLNQEITLENKCYYPTPYFTNFLSGSPQCLGTPAFNIEVAEYNNAAGSVVPGSIMVNGVVTNVFDAAALGIGSHTIMATFDAGVAQPFTKVNGVVVAGSDAQAIADPGCKQKITQVVQVIATPGTLVCNDLVIISMDASCKVTVSPDDVLEGSYYCYDDYLVEVDKTLPMGNGPWVMPMFDAADLGKTFFYHVVHTTGGANLCWGQIKIEDKLAPALTCPADLTIACSESTDVSHTGNVDVADCSSYTRVIDDEYTDFGQCSNPRGQIVRTWIVTDAWGNQSTCTQTITITPFSLAAVVFPANLTINCESAYLNSSATAPDNTGRPSINGFPIGSGGMCTASIGYTDQRLDICPGSYEILREWSVRNTCLPLSASNPVKFTQIITVADLGGPAFVCPPAVMVSTDPLTCCATAALPSMIVSEGCSNIVGLEAKVTGVNPNNGNIITFTVPGYLADFPGNNWWNPDTLAVFNYTQCMPLGTYQVRYKASDLCGNTSFCYFDLTVADFVPPVAACDQTTVVGIGVDDPNDCYTPANGCDGAGVTWVKASTFDDGSYDNCNQVKVTVRRMAPYSDCVNSLSKDPCFANGMSEFDLATAEMDSIKFYCCEVGTTQTVIMRVYQIDVNGNYVPDMDGDPLYNECMIQVTVQDKVKPICQSPAHVTVSCEQFDPSLWVYGKADIFDNCCLDTTKVYQGQCGLTHSVSYSQFDTVCSKGTIVRTFRAFDCHANSSQCTQRIVVNYEQDYYVRFPNDVIVTVCDGTGVYGEPTFFGKDCELLGISYEDQIFTVVPDACFKIERNWKIINWCTYNPNGSCINVPNPSPNAIANHASNLPGPIVSPIQTTGDPWKSTIVALAPGQTPTNFSIYYDANANCYTYKQIIKIIDTHAPTTECPASPVTVCDLTANDVDLWNQSYWWDNGNQSHDLCEAPSDICLTATDACSGANINIEYLLFLDLDNDGIMETVVNSTQLGNQLGGLGWNNINFGNVSGVGVNRQFDGRAVPQNQKWGFAIQETVTGNKKTACVKFNTFQNQNTFVTPQLPHGTHKIKWIVSDGCGNESVCEYTIIVKDCKAPTVVCLNGLSVNIMPTGMIQLWATDFLQYAEDNCTKTPYLQYGIRKCGTGTGFPVDAQGNPITNVTFNCSELGTQCVELWAIDLAGNADYCETYVIVQDNDGNCGVTGTVNVSGALKTEVTDGIEEATVQVAGIGGGLPFNFSDMSDDQGLYAVNGLVPLNADLTITPIKDDNPLNGVTTYDLVLISKHILGIEPLGSPYKMIAADANKSNSITTFDIVELRKLILGIYQELPSNTSWRFVDKSFAFPNQLNPFQTQFPENISIPQAQGHQLNQDFIGVKIGDVNNTVVANSLMLSDERNNGTLLFDVEDRDVTAGQVFDVAFKASEKSQGYQMTLNLNGLSVTDIVESAHVTASNFGVFANALTVSIDNANGFTVKFRAVKSGKLSEMLAISSHITKAEAYSMADNKLDVALRYNSPAGTTTVGVGFELYQNQPNPFVNQTSISFHLPEATRATLTVYDENGKLIYRQNGDFAKGYNAFVIDRQLVGSTGALWYKVETSTDSAAKTMIQTK